MDNSGVRKIYRTAKYILFPLVLILFAFLKVNKGIDLNDTGYSLGNYRFFQGNDAIWMLLTFPANIVGYIMTLLPGGKTMLGMNVYSTLIIACSAVLSYRFFMTKMPAWLAFLSQIVALGMCWAPAAIIYHNLTYLLFLAAAIFVFRALAGCRPVCLVIAGILLGINTFTKFPGNGLQVLLIIPLIYYGIITHTDTDKVIRQVLLCVAGYIAGMVIVAVPILCIYGPGSLGRMLGGVVGISASASDYTFGQMLFSIIDAYLHGLRWGIYIIICALMGIPFFLLYPGKLVKARKVFYCLCIVFLFFVLMKWGMFNFKYYQKESALQWGAIFLLISIGVDVYVMASKIMNKDWKLISALSLVIVLVTPLGSNNYIWPVLNSLFLIAPVTFWVIYRFVRWGRTYMDSTAKVPLYGFKYMLAGCVIMFSIQAVGVGCMYIFADSEDMVVSNSRVTENPVLRNMYTNPSKAEAISSLTRFVSGLNDNSYKGLVTYGGIPGLNYILDIEPAISTIWPDLDSYPVETMVSDIHQISDSDEASPLIILSKSIYDAPDNSIKLNLINQLIETKGYQVTFTNDYFVVFN